MKSVTIRASSLADFLDCAARWGARHLDGLTLPRSAAAQLGTAVHAGTAVYDQSNLDKAGLTAADAAGAVVDAIREPAEEVDWTDVPPAKAEAKALELHDLYCATVAPKQEYVAVEIECEALTVDVDGFALTLTGTADRVRRGDAGLGIADIKTGKTAVSPTGQVKNAGHSAQLGVYSLLAEHVLGEDVTAPAQIIGLNTGAVRAGIGELPDPRQALIGPPDKPGVLEVVAQMLTAETLPGNPRSMLCSAKYCPAFHRCFWRK